MKNKICPKCDGKGILSQYIHDKNDGKCWRCSGTGEVTEYETKPRSKYTNKIKAEINRLKRDVEIVENIINKYPDYQPEKNSSILEGYQKKLKELMQ